MKKIVALLIGISLMSTVSANSEAITSQKEVKKIFFDLGGVLFDPHIPTVLGYMGGKNIAAFYTQLKIPKDIKTYVFEQIEHLRPYSAKSLHSSYRPAKYLGKPMPPVIDDWLASRQSNEAILKDITGRIDALKDASVADKNVMKTLLNYMMDPVKFTSSMKLIPEGLAIVKALKEEGHELYVISNWNGPSWDRLRKRENLQELWGMFDGFIISGKENVNKPDPEIYKIARTRAEMAEDEEGFFIDDQSENLEESEKHNLRGLLCNHANVWNELEKRKLIKPRTSFQKCKTKTKRFTTVVVLAAALYYGVPMVAKTSWGSSLLNNGLVSWLTSKMSWVTSRIIG